MSKFLGVFATILMMLATMVGAGAQQSEGHRSFGSQSGRPAFTPERTIQRPITTPRRTNVSKGSESGSTKKNVSSDKGTPASTARDRREESTTPKDTATKGVTPTSSASAAARDAKRPLQFVGKPTNIAHDPTHQTIDKPNDIGYRSDHQDVTVKTDDGYYRRSYYSSTDDSGAQTWYWYDTPLGAQEIALINVATVPVCGSGSDICAYAAGYTPVVVNTCGTDRAKKTDRNGLDHAIISCSNRGDDDPDLACNGTCKVIDPAGGDAGPGPVDAGAGSWLPNQVMYSYGCHCK